MKPEVSVLMSAYNAEETLSRCIESILNQSFTGFEFVIVNDGSTDQTEAIVKSFDDDRIRLLQPGRLGLAKALNYGLNQCHGKFIARMDADDWSHPARLEKQVNYLKNHQKVGVVSSLVEYAGNRNRNEGYALHVDWINQQVTHDQIFNNRFEDAPVANPSCMFRSNLIQEFGGYSEQSIPEDYEFWLRLLHFGVKFGKVNEVLLYWSDLPNRLTRHSSNYSQEAFLKVKAHYFKKWLNQHFKASPEIFVFGTGRSVNQKLKPFIAEDIKIHKRLEVKKLNEYPENTIHYGDLPKSEANNLVLSFIGNRTGKRNVEDHLHSLGYTKGLTYFMMY